MRPRRALDEEDGDDDEGGEDQRLRALEREIARMSMMPGGRYLEGERKVERASRRRTRRDIQRVEEELSGDV